MRLFPAMLALLIVFALGAAVGSSNFLQDKDTKKQEKKDKKTPAKESRVEKHSKDSFKLFQELRFKDFEGSEIRGKRIAENCVEYLNRTEETIAFCEKEIKASKNKELVEEAKMLLGDVIKFLDLKARTSKALLGTDRLRELAGEKAIVEYRLEWSPKGQWVVKMVKRGSV